MNIGSQIRNFRLKKRVTQEELAEYLKVSAQAVSKWETQASTPDIALLPSIATFFGITIDELFALPEEEQYKRIENMFWREQSIPQETFNQSVRFLQEQIAKDTQNVRAYLDLAKLYNYRALCDHQEASKFAKRVIELDPERHSGWVVFREANNAVCGDEWFDNHFYAIEYCKSILKKYPDNIHALHTVIANLLVDRRFDEAAVYVDKLREMNQHAWQISLYLGDVVYGKGDLEEAKRLWNKGVEEHPEYWQTYCSRADRMKKIGYIDEAIADYEKCMAIQTKPRLTDGLYSLAQIHEQIGDYEAAIRDNERIIQVLAEDYDTHSGESVDARRREIKRLEEMISEWRAKEKSI